MLPLRAERWSEDLGGHGPERGVVLENFEKMMGILFGIAGDGNY